MRGRSISPADSIIVHETEPTQVVPTAKAQALTQKPVARKWSSYTATGVAAVPAQIKRQHRSTSQPPILDVQDHMNSHGLQWLHPIPKDDDKDGTFPAEFSNDDDTGLSFQPLFRLDKGGAKDFFTVLLSGGPAHSDSEFRDFDEDGIEDEDFTKDLNNTSDSLHTDLDGSGSESNDAFLASCLPALLVIVNKRSAKSSSTIKTKTFASLKPLYDPQTCHECFMMM